MPPRDATRDRPTLRLRAAGVLLVLAGAGYALAEEVRVRRDTVVVTLLARRHDAAGIARARRERDPRDDPAEVYGTPVGRPFEVVDPSPGTPAWFAPPEDPALRLLPLERASAHPKPLRVRLEALAIGGSLGAAGALVLLVAARRRRPGAPPAGTAVALLGAVGLFVGCAVSPAGAGRAPGPGPLALDPAYVRPGPTPRAEGVLVATTRTHERLDVTLPPKAPGDAPPEARAPIRMRWWRPLAAARVRAPAVVLSPILGSETAFVEGFAERFVREGWHALVVFRAEVDYDPARPLGQVEERLADGVRRRVEALDWLLATGDVDPSRVASFGISAGGIEGALVAGTDGRYAAHVIGLAGGPLADVFVESDEGDIRRLVERATTALGVDRETLRARLRREIRTDPVLLGSRVDPASVLLVLARRDRAVPAHTGESLRAALGDPATIRLPLGHYPSVLFLPFVRPRVVEFLRARFDAARGGG